MIKSRKILLFACGIFLLNLPLARAQDSDNDAIPAGSFQIINPHDSEITFELYRNGIWTAYKILPLSDKVLDTVPMYFRIETYLGSAVSSSGDSVRDVSVIADFQRSETSFVRKLTGGRRWLICWSNQLDNGQSMFAMVKSASNAVSEI